MTLESELYGSKVLGLLVRYGASLPRTVPGTIVGTQKTFIDVTFKKLIDQSEKMDMFSKSNYSTTHNKFPMRGAD